MTSLLRPQQELPTEPSALPGEVGKELSPELVMEKDETADPRPPAAGTLHRRVVFSKGPRGGVTSPSRGPGTWTLRGRYVVRTVHKFLSTLLPWTLQVGTGQ